MTHGLIRPNSGWTFLYDEDLGDLCGNCEYCGTDLRYLYYIDHPKWDPLAVGTDCCDRLTGSDIALNLRRRTQRLDTFIRSARWRETDQRFLIRQKQMDFAIVALEGGYRVELASVGGRELFRTVEAATKKIFEIVESGEAERFLHKRNQKQNGK